MTLNNAENDALERLGAGIMPKWEYFKAQILPFIKPWPEAKNKAAWRKAILAPRWP